LFYGPRYVVEGRHPLPPNYDKDFRPPSPIICFRVSDTVIVCCPSSPPIVCFLVLLVFDFWFLTLGAPWDPALGFPLGRSYPSPWLSLPLSCVFRPDWPGKVLLCNSLTINLFPLADPPFHLLMPWSAFGRFFWGLGRQPDTPFNTSEYFSVWCWELCSSQSTSLLPRHMGFLAPLWGCFPPGSPLPPCCPGGPASFFQPLGLTDSPLL